MNDRLSALDASFLYLESPTTPMHVGGVATFAQPPDGLRYKDFLKLIEQRIGFVPRYRQKVRTVPGNIASPVWVDDPSFDITYHVRHAALPKPGTDSQLWELTARIISRRLDRHRPLWEMYFVEGLQDDRIALIMKSHHAMVDGVSAINIGQVVLDTSPEGRLVAPAEWRPRPSPTSARLIWDSFIDFVRRPTGAFDAVKLAVVDARATADRLRSMLGGLAAAMRTASRPVPESPLNVPIGEQRLFSVVRTQLDTYKKISKVRGCTVNDVVLATVAGGLRRWLLARGEFVQPGSTIRALVPLSVRAPSEQGALGNKVSAYLVDLPIGEESATRRLAEVSEAMYGHKLAGQSVGADVLVRLYGFAPPTLHALGARVANSMSRHVFNVTVTNVPGPQIPLYAAGAEMLEVFPVAALAKGQALSIGLTSYNGAIYYGLNVDRDAIGDVDVISESIKDSLEELAVAVQ